MKLKIKLQHLQELEGALKKAPVEVKKNLRLATKVSLRDIQERAAKEHKFISRTETLERSIEQETLSEWPVEARVWLNPKELTVKAKRTGKSYNYGACLHEGTRAYEITPFDKKALRWVGAGDVIFFAKRVRHKKKTGDPFIYIAAEKERDNINDIFNRYTLRALKEAGVHG